MSFDYKNVNPINDYRNIPIVSGIETADNNHRHPKGKSASRSTRMFGIEQNKLTQRTVSGNAKK